MTWFKVDDHFHDDRKTRGLDLAAIGLWTMAGTWSGDNKTDGFVPETVPARWHRSPKKLAAALIERGLWEADEVDGETGWRFVDWDENQPTKAETDTPTERLRWKRKAALKRDRNLLERIVTRDRNQCRYCGVRVDFKDRRGANGGTYDHVDPDGDNSLGNVVVACRRCNGRKRDRTPTEAKMPLRPVPSAFDPDAPETAPEEPRSDPGLPGALPQGGTDLDRIRVEPDRGPVRARSEAVPVLNGNGHGAPL